MPQLDRTGPESKGAKTGRGMGRCNPDHSIQIKSSTDSNQGTGRRGLGRGKGLGRGFGRGRS